MSNTVIGKGLWAVPSGRFETVVNRLAVVDKDVKFKTSCLVDKTLEILETFVEVSRNADKFGDVHPMVDTTGIYLEATKVALMAIMEEVEDWMDATDQEKENVDGVA